MSAACVRCGEPLTPEALVCERCHTLRYADELERLSTQAGDEERLGRFSASRDTWRLALSYLPPHTKQATWIVEHLDLLAGESDDVDVEGQGTAAAPSWVARLGPLAPVAILLFKSKALIAIFNVKTLVSFGAFVALYGRMFGAWFGFGFAAQILVHELGHFVDVRRRGLPADMPVFLPGLGAYVRWRAAGVPAVVRAEVSLAGPLAGLFAAAVCAMVWMLTASPIMAALARSGAWLNILNLVPVWALDGGQAATVLDRNERLAVLWTSLALWLLTGEGVLALVAGGAVWRLFTHDRPAEPSRQTTAYFLGLLVALSMLMWSMPGHGAGIS